MSPILASLFLVIGLQNCPKHHTEIQELKTRIEKLEQHKTNFLTDPELWKAIIIMYLGGHATKKFGSPIAKAALGGLHKAGRKILAEKGEPSHAKGNK